MKKLTIFSAPKPFVDPHIDLIQHNAICSWQQMGADVEILLMGDEPGIAKAANELKVTHVPNVERNDQGTPLISSIFRKANELSHASLLMFINTDLLLFPETLDVSLNMQKQFSEFILLGQRYDLDVPKKLEFTKGWMQKLRGDVQNHGRLHPLGGSDYFIFPRGLFQSIPDFAVGRAGWDNWIIYYGIAQGWLVVDATPSLMVIHQNHDYGHLSGDRGHQRHPETMKNLELAGGMRKMYSLLDVRFQLVDGKIQPIHWSLPRALHRLEQRLQPQQMVGRGPQWWLLRGIRKLRRALQGVTKN
jgi:hypothetical protein